MRVHECACPHISNGMCKRQLKYRENENWAKLCRVQSLNFVFSAAASEFIKYSNSIYCLVRPIHRTNSNRFLQSQKSDSYRWQVRIEVPPIHWVPILLSLDSIRILCWGTKPFNENAEARPSAPILGDEESGATKTRIERRRMHRVVRCWTRLENRPLEVHRWQLLAIEAHHRQLSRENDNFGARRKCCRCFPEGIGQTQCDQQPRHVLCRKIDFVQWPTAHEMASAHCAFAPRNRNIHWSGDQRYVRNGASDGTGKDRISGRTGLDESGQCPIGSGQGPWPGQIPKCTNVCANGQNQIRYNDIGLFAEGKGLLTILVSSILFNSILLILYTQIDLLAAARCNMFSHVLVAYQAALLDYATKTSSTYQAALKILSEKTHYNFTVLKDLTQVPVVRDGDIGDEKKDMTPLDFDQMLFFKVKSIIRDIKLICFHEDTI